MKDSPQPNTTSTDPKPPAEKPDAPVVPDAYADFKVPEGFTLDKDLIAEATPVFKELGLTQDQAQKLVDMQAKRETALSKAGQTTYDTMREGWRNEVKADADIGSKLDTVKATIAKGLDSLGDAKLTTSFKEAMNLTGAGDHPAVVKALYKFAQAVTEGTHVSGRGPSPHGQGAPDARPATVASAIYPNLK